MFTLIMPVLIIQENAKPFYIVVVCIFTLLDKCQVYLWNSAVFFADSVNNNMVIFPAKHIYGKIWILLLEFISCETGVGNSIPVKLRPLLVG